MNKKPVFEGLIFDEYDNPVDVTYVGEEPFYVVDDAGFFRHIPSSEVDSQVLQTMTSQIQGNEDLISEQTAKMLGQEDLFTKAIIQNQLKNIDKQLESLLKTGIPNDGRQYLGLMGFKIIINVHGEIVKIEQPGISQDPDNL